MKRPEPNSLRRSQMFDQFPPVSLQIVSQVLRPQLSFPLFIASPIIAGVQCREVHFLSDVLNTANGGR